MIKRSLKYFLIALTNLALHTVLLALWTDKLERQFNLLVRPFEFLKIIFFTFLSLIGMRILVWYFRKKKISDTRIKIKYATVLTMTMCSLLYFPYINNTFQNRILNATTREHILNKMSDPNQAKADSLTFEEYSEIMKIGRFPKIPESSGNISVNYYEDVLLPDFSISVTYDVPKSEVVFEMNYTNGQYSKSISVEESGDKRRVYYHEGEW